MWVNQLCKPKLLWQSQLHLPLVQFVPQHPVLQEYPKRQQLWNFFMLPKVAIRLLIKDHFDHLTGLLKPKHVYIFCLTYDVAWFARFSRRSLVSR